MFLCTQESQERHIFWESLVFNANNDHNNRNKCLDNYRKLCDYCIPNYYQIILVFMPFIQTIVGLKV
jgi:hypothetical protein